MNTPKGFATLVEHFQKQNWQAQANTERRILQSSFSLEHGRYRGAALVHADDDLLQFFSFVPVIVPPNRRTAVAELCVRINFRLKLGVFKLDLEDGELRLQTCVPYPKGVLSEEVIRHVIGTNLETIDRHFRAFMAIIFAGAAPREAWLQVQQETQGAPAELSEAVVLEKSRVTFN